MQVADPRDIGMGLVVAVFIIDKSLAMADKMRRSGNGNTHSASNAYLEQKMDRLIEISSRIEGGINQMVKAIQISKSIGAGRG